MNSQELILQAIAKAVEADENVTLLDDRTYGNTGTLRTVRRATLDHVASVSYDFQSGYCHFGPTTNRVAALWYGQPKKEGQTAWVKGSIAELVDTVVAHLLGGKP